MLLAAAVPLLALAFAPSSSAGGDPVPAKNGHYVGVGDDQFRVSFFAHQRTVEDLYRTFPFPPGAPSQCSSGGKLAGSDDVNDKGRFRIDNSAADTEDSARGRFAAPTRVTGRYLYENSAICPGAYEYPYKARKFGPQGAQTTKAPAAAKRGTGSPRNGEYAGGSGTAAVWFNVVGGEVQLGRVRGLFPTCDSSLHVFDSDEPNDKGRFAIEYTLGGDTVKIKGRFTSRARVKGKAVWDQDDACPAGIHKFDYNARRFGPVG